MKDSIERTIILSAPIDRVWRALSDHLEFGTWFKAAISEPFAPGAVIACQSTYPGHEHLTWSMTIVEMEPNKLISFTWPAYYGDDVDRDANQDHHLKANFLLERCEGGTQLTLKETGFSKLPPDYAPTAFRMNEDGWDEQMNNIMSHVTD